MKRENRLQSGCGIRCLNTSWTCPHLFSEHPFPISIACLFPYLCLQLDSEQLLGINCLVFCFVLVFKTQMPVSSTKYLINNQKIHFKWKDRFFSCFKHRWVETTVLLKEIGFRFKMQIEHIHLSSHPPKIHVKPMVKRFFLWRRSS